MLLTVFKAIGAFEMPNDHYTSLNDGWNNILLYVLYNIDSYRHNEPLEFKTQLSRLPNICDLQIELYTISGKPVGWYGLKGRINVTGIEKTAV